MLTNSCDVLTQLTDVDDARSTQCISSSLIYRVFNRFLILHNIFLWLSSCIYMSMIIVVKCFILTVTHYYYIGCLYTCESVPDP